MKKYLLLLLTVFVLSSCEEDTTIIDATADTLEKRPNQITICHYNKGNDTWKTIEIQEKQLQRHLDHGDILGACGEDYTYVPDDNFEQALILAGIDSDGVINDRVATDDISGIPTLDIGYKNIKDLTGIEGFINLIELNCRYNQLTSIDISKNTKLLNLFVGNNQLSRIDVSQNIALRFLYLDTNQLTKLDVSQNINLRHLNFARNQLRSVDISKNTLLEELACSYNRLFKLDISNNAALTVLHCTDINMINLDVSKHTDLIFLYCSGNQLTKLDVSQNTSLQILRCYDNQITDIDLSQNSDLVKFYGHNNQLTSLNIKNANNSILHTLNVENNPSLSCIQVDNAGDANLGIGYYVGWKKDVTAVYSEDCLN